MTHTSMPHSGTRSRLLNTTTRSHTRALASGEEAAVCLESCTRSVRHLLNAPGCVDPINNVLPQKSGRERKKKKRK